VGDRVFGRIPELFSQLELPVSSLGESHHLICIEGILGLIHAPVDLLAKGFLTHEPHQSFTMSHIHKMAWKKPPSIFDVIPCT
jgi:hypothetical protein